MRSGRSCCSRDCVEAQMGAGCCYALRQEVWESAHLTEISRVGSAMMGKSTVICAPSKRHVNGWASG